jgi:ABC-type branched-subunit amino acid transport system substrate-binding protein
MGREPNTSDTTFLAGQFKPDVLARIFEGRIRVVLVMASSADVLDIARAAKQSSYGVQGWAWLGLDTVPAPKEEPDMGYLYGWVYFETDSSVPDWFVGNVSATIRAMFPFDDSPISSLAANLYDAITLYGSVVRAHLSELRQGTVMVRAMMNVSLSDGISGKVELDDNADRKAFLRVMNRLPADGKTIRLGVVGTDQPFTESSDHLQARWPPGSSTERPAATLPPVQCPAGTASGNGALVFRAAACKECEPGERL